jgi:chromosome segregation ATPase
MKHLEVLVQQLQDELNMTKSSLMRRSNNTLNENIDVTSANASVCSNSQVGIGILSAHVSPNQHLQQQSTNSSSSAQLELLRTNEKLLKEKIDSLKCDLSRKETELQQLKTKYETCESKERDQQHYLTLLKESMSTKDQQISMQQSEVNDLRTRLREKESLIEKKNQYLQAIQIEKHQRDSDVGELRDQMDIKERKINVLNRKIDNLEEQLKDKEIQVQTLRTKLNTAPASSYHSSFVHALEQSIEEKDRIIDKLNKEAQTRIQGQSRESELKEQIETLNISIKELTDKIEVKNKEIQESQVIFFFYYYF